MRRTFATALLAVMAVMLFAPIVFAAEGGEASEAQLNYYAMAVLGSTLGMGIAALGASIGMGLGIGRACEGVARNPGVSNKIMTTMIVGLALVESLAIYTLVVVLIVFFVNPFGV